MKNTLNTPLVSLIVPMYGVENYIARCAESLFAQTYPNIEFIFVDDGGKDRTVEILRGILEKQDPALQARVRIISKENGGLPRARKTGLDAATGEYVLHVDSDDWLEPATVEKLVAKAVETDADIVVYDFWKEYPNHSKLDSEKDSSCADPELFRRRRFRAQVCDARGHRLQFADSVQGPEGRPSEGRPVPLRPLRLQLRDAGAAEGPAGEFRPEPDGPVCPL